MGRSSWILSPFKALKNRRILQNSAPPKKKKGKEKKERMKRVLVFMSVLPSLKLEESYYTKKSQYHRISRHREVLRDLGFIFVSQYLLLSFV